MSTESRPEIVGLGKARGSRNITNFDIAQILGVKPEVVERMAKPIGLQERGWCNEDESTSTLAAIAAGQAIEMSGIQPDKITCINVATNFPDHLGSPTGALVQKILGLKKEIATRDISAACPGFIHALQITYSSLSAKYGKIGGPQLTIAAEPGSFGVNPKKRNTFILFGDAAGAVVVDNLEVDTNFPKPEFEFGADGDYFYDLYVPAGGAKTPVTQKVIDEGLNCISMRGAIVEEQAIKKMSELAEKVLKKAGAAISDIDLFVPHQANLKIIAEVAKKLNFPIERVFINIQKYGNTSAASVPVGLCEAFEQGKLKRGDIVLSTTFGAGLNYAAAFLPMNGLPEK